MISNALFCAKPAWSRWEFVLKMGVSITKGSENVPEGRSLLNWSIQNNSNLDTPCHTWNSTSLPPAPAGGQSHSHSKTQHLPSGHFDNFRSRRGNRIYADGSKTEKGVGAAFCVWSGQNKVYRWLAKLQDYDTVFQAELLALKHAIDHATSLLHQPITILVDNQESVQAAANPRSINTTAREICKSLITNKHIHISWIKAQVGYDGNEEEDRLAKEAAESNRDPLSVKARFSS
ncbi:hypothetical protein AVEN_157837-1 [Araneus ventricosus]|uniref:RNase H type-1 domain-containing protein n=1 Tax=Araneus ventricosus TaxID=182803 RepID=A0A4Y2E9Q0_ARAVE|nr:hypothetical protein AVEN_157837-1 [Araneus ventricosus]